MKMKSLDHIILGTFLIAVLTSCDATREDFYVVKNKSDYTVQSSPNQSGNPIESGATDTIFRIDLIRGMEDMGEEFLTYHGQEIELNVISNSIVLNIDPNSRSNWEYSQQAYEGMRDKDGSSGECYYVLEILNEHVK